MYREQYGLFQIVPVRLCRQNLALQGQQRTRCRIWRPVCSMSRRTGIAARAALRIRRRISHRRDFLNRTWSSASNHPHPGNWPFLYHSARGRGSAQPEARATADDGPGVCLARSYHEVVPRIDSCSVSRRHIRKFHTRKTKEGKRRLTLSEPESEDRSFANYFNGPFRIVIENLFGSLVANDHVPPLAEELGIRV